ncbi:oligopeptide:H+ symporter [Acaricomes phytoseiuli]|uniref:peptide MFS transporter n=1 Tax=Acaricomes phytoseiuli TaxID=291968 RepID=UPI00222342FC|nr:oligopeptide:H+ symporter [Acaricomes phytoseiuli]MCW1249700.1 oligopeptide:H+ symporter [Acaricomes phytoseiuli]
MGEPLPGGKTFFGHPAPLINLFSIELWERFSFSGMQIIATYYMYFSLTDGGLGIDRGVATSLIGAYGGMVYLSTILGAWVADRLWGGERVLFYSGVMIMVGHIALAVVPGIPGLAIGLILVGVGSGGLKANATAIVGTLYAPADVRRDAGFSIFYMGINIGAFAGPLLTGFARDQWGFHVAFGVAAVGMALGLTQYALTRKSLPENARVVPNPLPRSKYPLAIGISIASLGVIVLLVATGIVTAANLVTVIIFAAIVATVAYFVVILRNPKVQGVERSRVYSFIPMFLASAAFWSLFQQQFTVFPVYAEERLNRNFFGWDFLPEWVGSINPVFIIIFAGVFAALWTKLGNRQPSSPVKFSLGLGLMGLAFLGFLPFAGGAAGSVPLLGLVGILFLFTMAELMLSPVGLSLATKLAPESYRAQMVALFFLSISLGSAIAGQLSTLYHPGSSEGTYFTAVGGTAIILALALAAAIKPIRKLMAGVH